MEEAKKLLKHAEKFADHAQVNIIFSREKSLSIKNNSIKTFQESDEAQYAVRVWIKGKEGYAYSNKFDMDIVKKAVNIAKLNAKKEYFYGLPDIQKYTKVNLFDKNITDISEDAIVYEAKKMIKDIVGDDVILSSGGVNSSCDENIVLNSNGIEAYEKSTEYSIAASTVAKKDGKVSSWYDDKEDFKFFKNDGWGTDVKEKTLFYLDAEHLKAKPKIVVLNPQVFSSLASYSLLANFNGKNIEKHKSLFCGKVNEQIMDKNISIFDDGLKGLNAGMFDDEGTASKNTALVQDGVLKQFIYDYNTAKNANTESTGNSSASNIDFTNVFIKGHKKDITDGLLIESIMGAHTSNPLTTEFSVKVEHAIYEGKPIKDVMISGKLIDVMNNVLGIGKKVQQKGVVVTGNVASDAINVVFE